MLTVNTEFRHGIMFVRLKGDLTKDTVNKLDKKVTNKVRDFGICNLVFNVTNLTKIDYRGINKLLYNYELCKKNHGKTLLCGNNYNINIKLKRSRLLNYIYEISDELCAMKIINM